MQKNMQQLALEWAIASRENSVEPPAEQYCQTRDVFQARLDTMRVLLLQSEHITNDTVYLVTAVAGEIGNNSFDHNIGNWSDIPGVFFGYDFSAAQHRIILADRGQGVLATLQTVKPELQEHGDAITVAFQEKISGRAPERRGNGLKFVRTTISAAHMHLVFLSGDAEAELNQKMSVRKGEKYVHGCLAVLTFSHTVGL